MLCKHQNKYVFLFSNIFLILANCQIAQNQLHDLEVLYLAHAWLSMRDQRVHQRDKTSSGSEETRRDYRSYVWRSTSFKVISRGIGITAGHLPRVLGKKGLASAS